MIDRLEKANLQDLGFARVFGMDESEVERLSLFRMKNEMHTKAFNMRDRKETISQEEADELNKKLNEIISALEEYDYDPMEDYIVDFDSFVIGNSYYNRFCW